MADRPPISIPGAQPQATIHQLLLTARKVWLSDALADALEDVDQLTLKTQVLTFVPEYAQRILAVAGIRDEAVFPVPVVIEARPTLIVYYRLLLGASKKRFYASGMGTSSFGKLEDGAPLSSFLAQQLPALCSAMCHNLADLVLQTAGSLESRDVEDLQLLTLGPYYYGSLNNKIGQIATLGVFTSVAEVVDKIITNRTKDSLDLLTPHGRTFHIQVASDPDMRIVEIVDGVDQPIVSVEIKGGTDKSNVYNRGGEAEKSHQAARSRGYETCWTIIHMANVDIEKLKQGSPTTTHWFDTNEVVGQKGEDWVRFQQEMLSALE